MYNLLVLRRWRKGFSERMKRNPHMFLALLPGLLALSLAHYPAMATPLTEEQKGQAIAALEAVAASPSAETTAALYGQVSRPDVTAEDWAPVFREYVDKNHFSFAAGGALRDMIGAEGPGQEPMARAAGAFAAAALQSVLHQTPPNLQELDAVLQWMLSFSGWSSARDSPRRWWPPSAWGWTPSCAVNPWTRPSSANDRSSYPLPFPRREKRPRERSLAARRDNLPPKPMPTARPLPRRPLRRQLPFPRLPPRPPCPHPPQRRQPHNPPAQRITRPYRYPNQPIKTHRNSLKKPQKLHHHPRCRPQQARPRYLRPRFHPSFQQYIQIKTARKKPKKLTLPQFRQMSFPRPPCKWPLRWVTMPDRKTLDVGCACQRQRSAFIRTVGCGCLMAVHWRRPWH